MKPTPNETPRKYYGRNYTVATELRAVFNVDVIDDMVCRAFFKGLLDIAKKEFYS